MKIVFSNLPMKKQLHAFKYKVEGNVSIEYEGEVVFPVNSVLAKTMKKGEKIKVVLLSKVDIEGNSAINAGKFQKNALVLGRGILHGHIRRFCPPPPSGRVVTKILASFTNFRRKTSLVKVLIWALLPKLCG